MYQQKAHLQEYLQLVGNDGGRAVIEIFGAIAPLENKGLPFLRRRQLSFQGIDLPGGDQGRQPGQLFQCFIQGPGRWVVSLLPGGFFLPGGRVPVVHDL